MSRLPRTDPRQQPGGTADTIQRHRPAASPTPPAWAEVEQAVHEQLPCEHLSSCPAGDAEDLLDRLKPLFTRQAEALAEAEKLAERAVAELRRCVRRPPRPSPRRRGPTPHLSPATLGLLADLERILTRGTTPAEVRSHWIDNPAYPEIRVAMGGSDTADAEGVSPPSEATGGGLNPS